MAAKCCVQVGFQEGVFHPVFGKWESVIFDEALKRRILISSRAEPNLYELGEAAFLEMPQEQVPQDFMRFYC